MLNYFGDAAPDYCGSCDVCLNKPVLHDATITAQKILSTVARVKEAFGARYIVDVLRGSNNEKMRTDHKSLSVYGLGKDVGKEEWLHYTKELINYEYLQQTDGQYPVLQLTEKGKAVLYKKEPVYLGAPVNIEIATEPRIYQQHPYEKELFENLKQLRNKIAREENVPAYIIFSDSTLLDVATYLPVIAVDLLKISGFGAFKAERYGPAFLEMVQQYCYAYKIETRIGLKHPKRERKAKTALATEGPSETKRVSYQMYKEGKAIDEIATERNLSVMTVEGHLSYYISKGDLQINNFVDTSKQQAIKQAAELFGAEPLRTLKENLPEEITYGEIRMVLASMSIEER
jgi:ATP-dependent DNA helicase RecQ